MKTKLISKRTGYISINRYTLMTFFILFAYSIKAQDNYATKLGYPADAKLLIIHADDLGMSHSENIASFEAIENGSVNSASVMMPAPWVLEVADYAKKHAKTHDLGLHLVFSSEWKYYKMGPVSPIDQVSSLVDEHGYFHDAFRPTFNPKELELEFRAQIDRAYAMGIDPSHLDVHMGGLPRVKELYEVYLKIGQIYKLPVRVGQRTKKLREELLQKYDVQIVLDNRVGMSVDEYAQGSEEHYTNAIKGLKPGLTLLVIHTAYDNDEMKGMTIDHPNWGSEWRQKDFDFFTSETCSTLLEKENIKLVTWRQLRKVFYSK